MILVVGATGTLGSHVVQKLALHDCSVRALVRNVSKGQQLRNRGVELAIGDLRDKESVFAACQGVQTVIATANAAGPQPGGSFEEIEGVGYENLIRAAQQYGIRQFIFISVPETPYDDRVPTFRYKRLIERRLQESGLAYTIVRSAPFMEDWLALVAGSLPSLLGKATVFRRLFWLARSRAFIHEKLGDAREWAFIPGMGSTSHAFVSRDDVATALVKAVDHPALRHATIPFGGPRSLSWDEVVEAVNQITGLSVFPLYTPAPIFRMQQLLMWPLSPFAANLLGMFWLLGSVDTPYERTAEISLQDGLCTGIEDCLRRLLDKS